MRVLFVNHTGALGGGEISLLDLIRSLPPSVEPLVACPEGDLASTLRMEGVPVQTIPSLEASLRLHPVQTARGLVQLVRAGVAIRRAARAHGAEIIQANSIRAGLIAIVATSAGGPPVIVHVRDCLPDSRPANAIRTVIRRRAAKVLAVSRYTAANFIRHNEAGDVEVIYCPIELGRFDPDRIDRERARQKLGVGSDATVMAVVGQITPWKGHDTAIEAMALLGERAGDVLLVIVGSVKFASDATRYANASYQRSLEQMVSERGLDGKVRFVGERDDMPEVMSAIDVLLAPSWEEPFGRAVVEAMAMEKTVIATSIGGPAEVIEDRVSGRLLDPHDAPAWAEAIEELVSAPHVRTKMGKSARSRAASFQTSTHVESVLNAYRDVLACAERGDGDQRRGAARDRISA